MAGIVLLPKRSYCGDSIFEQFVCSISKNVKLFFILVIKVDKKCLSLSPFHSLAVATDDRSQFMNNYFFLVICSLPNLAVNFLSQSTPNQENKFKFPDSQRDGFTLQATLFPASSD